MAEFISIINNTKGGDSPNLTKKTFNKEFQINNIQEMNQLYKYCNNNNNNNKQIFIAENNYACVPIISGINEKYMVREGDAFVSNLKILYFSNYHDLENFDSETINNSIISGLCGWTKLLFENHNLIIKPEQIILIGLNDLDIDLDLDTLQNLNIEYYTLTNIKKKGFDIILNNILTRCQNNYILSVFNIEVFNKKIAPSVIRRNINNNINNNNNGISYEELINITNILQNKIKYLVITGFNSNINNNTSFHARMTSEIVQIIYRNILNLKEKKINIFNENSKFLIYRKQKIATIDDYGWYILRFMSIDDRERLLKYVPDDTIISINISDYGEKIIDHESEESEEYNDILENEIMISSTNIYEQNEKSYYAENSTDSRVLFPQEKFLMGFELVNL